MLFLLAQLVSPPLQPGPARLPEPAPLEQPEPDTPNIETRDENLLMARGGLTRDGLSRTRREERAHGRLCRRGDKLLCGASMPILLHCAGHGIDAVQHPVVGLDYQTVSLLRLLLRLIRA